MHQNNTIGSIVNFEQVNADCVTVLKLKLFYQKFIENVYRRIKIRELLR